ncbi:hypothetical protein [Enterococcus bulliens]
MIKTSSKPAFFFLEGCIALLLLSGGLLLIIESYQTMIAFQEENTLEQAMSREVYEQLLAKQDVQTTQLEISKTRVWFKKEGKVLEVYEATSHYDN